jgi:short-subunit dehydrogenase
MKLIDKYGKWAIITGASSGIGEEFANRLSAEGFNLIIVARRKDKLENLAKKLSAINKVEIIPVELDLTEDNFVKKLLSVTAGKEIGMLVNNAGFGSTGEFINTDTEHEIKMVKLNCLAPVILTHYYVNEMKDRNKGALVFLGSVVAFQPTPLMATYSATKVFNLFLGNSLWWELKKYNIDVLSLNPGGTDTEFQRISDAKTGPVPRTAKQVVDTAMQALGKKPSVVDGFFNKIASVSSRFVSSRMMLKISGGIADKFYRDKNSQ